MGDYARIAFVVQNNVDVLLVDKFAVLPSDVALFQIVGNGICLKALCVFQKYLPHGIGLCFIDDVLLVLNYIPERRNAASSVAFDPTFAQAAVDFLP